MSMFTRPIEVADLKPGMRFQEEHDGREQWFLIEDITDMTDTVRDEEGTVTATPYRGAIVTFVNAPGQGALRVIKIHQPVRVRVAGLGEKKGQPLLYPTTSGVGFKDVDPPAEVLGGDRVERFTTAGGMPYTVRIVPAGVQWGPDLMAVAGETVVEFYGPRRTGELADLKRGQFIARFTLDVLMRGDDDRGLFLTGGWSVDPTTTDDIRAWVRRTVTALYNSTAKLHPYSEPPSGSGDEPNYQCIEVGGVQVYVYVDWLDGGPTVVVSPHFDTTDPGLMDPGTDEVRIAMKNGVGDIDYP